MITKNNWIDDLERVISRRSIITDPDILLSYQSDGYTLEKGKARGVVAPQSSEEVSHIVKVLANHEIPYVARGAGTSLSGGAIPADGAVIIHLSRMNKIFSIDTHNAIVECQPGVVNAHISQKIRPLGYFYAPDPSSQQSCTIGGNVAENSGGPHCLKYGVTLNHILQAEVVLPDGDMVVVGNLGGFPEPIDWLSLIIGSEGTLGIVTRVWLRILPVPEHHATLMAIFDSVNDASSAVSQIIADGIVPAALEMMDPLAIYAVERGAFPVGYPGDAKGVLLVEVDGTGVEVEEEIAQIERISRQFHARHVKRAETENERELWWSNRKTAFGAMGLISPQYYVQDGVIPRSQLPQALEAIQLISDHFNIRIANVFHAGDGNLHPLLLYDHRNPEEVERVRLAGSAVLKVCIELGGTITGEHGIGLEKMCDMLAQFSEAELTAQRFIKTSFDPKDLANPGKILPNPARCRAEVPM